MNTRRTKNYLLSALAFGGITYAAYWFYSKKQTAKSLNVKLRTIKLEPISEAAIQIQIDNPTPTDLVLNAINADLSINNTPISTLNFNGKKIIPANNSTTIDLRIQINPFEAIKFFGDVFLNKAGLNDISVAGNVSAENMVFPFSLTQKLKLF